VFSFFTGPSQDVPASTFGSSGCMLHVPKCHEDFSSLGQYPAKMSHLLAESMCYVPKCYQDVSPFSSTCEDSPYVYFSRMHVVLCTQVPVKRSHLSAVPCQVGPPFSRMHVMCYVPKWCQDVIFQHYPVNMAHLSAGYISQSR